MKLTLAGFPGSGKSTLRASLASHYGLKVKGTGDFMREIAKKYGYGDITKFLVEYVSAHPEIDREVDEEQRRWGAEHDGFVLDAHLGFLFVPDSLKVFLRCDLEVSSRRILDAKRETEEARDLKSAMDAARKRMETMRGNFRGLYGVDMHDEANFDFVVDTTHLTPEEVRARVIAFVDSRTK